MVYSFSLDGYLQAAGRGKKSEDGSTGNVKVKSNGTSNAVKLKGMTGRVVSSSCGKRWRKN